MTGLFEGQRGRGLKILALLAGIQGLFYTATGLWSLVDIHSFMLVTGPKADIWLVRTVGLLVTVSGFIFLWSASKASFPPQVFFLAAGQALALALIEIYYVGMGRISPVYLADAVIELAFCGLWLWGWPKIRLKQKGEG